MMWWSDGTPAALPVGSRNLSSFGWLLWLSCLGGISEIHGGEPKRRSRSLQRICRRFAVVAYGKVKLADRSLSMNTSI